MDPKLIEYLGSLLPAVDAAGRWACFGNAKTAQKSMMLGILDYRQVYHRRGVRNWRRVWEQVVVPRLERNRVLLFTFVRNPWDRVVSAFFFLQQRGTLPKKLQFKEFVKRELVQGYDNVDRHFRPQAPTFMWNGKIIPQMFIGRYEHLRVDWAYIAGWLHEEKELPHINASKHREYTAYYDVRSIEIVREIYRTEIDALGYEFGE